MWQHALYPVIQHMRSVGVSDDSEACNKWFDAVLESFLTNTSRTDHFLWKIVGDLQRYKGQLFNNGDSFRDAYESYRNAVRLSPSSGIYYSQLGMVCVLLSRDELRLEAVFWYVRALSVEKPFNGGKQSLIAYLASLIDSSKLFELLHICLSRVRLESFDRVLAGFSYSFDASSSLYLSHILIGLFHHTTLSDYSQAEKQSIHRNIFALIQSVVENTSGVVFTQFILLWICSEAFKPFIKSNIVALHNLQEACRKFISDPCDALGNLKSVLMQSGGYTEIDLLCIGFKPLEESHSSESIQLGGLQDALVLEKRLAMLALMFCNVTSEPSSPQDEADIEIQNLKQQVAGLSKSVSEMQSSQKPLAILKGFTMLVLDTNCYIHDLEKTRELIESKEWNVVIPLAIVAELDGLRLSAECGQQAKKAIEFIEAKIHSVHIMNQSGEFIKTLQYRAEKWSNSLLSGDDAILQACMQLSKDKDGIASVALVTNDVNFRIRAMSLNLTVVESVASVEARN